MPATHEGLPPGWYYTQGDPPGTQRYWDGTQWLGGLQAGGGNIPTVAGGSSADSAPIMQLYRGGDICKSRFAANLIDMVPLVAIGLLTIVIKSALGEELDLAAGLVGQLLMHLVGFVNLVWFQSDTGQSLGKKLTSTRISAVGTDQPPSMGQLAQRYIPVGVFIMSWIALYTLILFVALAIIPWLLDGLSSLRDTNNQRLSDKATKTVVVSTRFAGSN